MQGEKTLESLIRIDGQQICIIRDIYERNAPECRRCRLRKVCTTPTSQAKLDELVEQLNRNIYRREFYEDLNEFYGDATYSEV